MCIDKKQDVAEEFNDFFVNVGLNLARDIVEPKEKNGLDELIENNLQSLYLSEVSESEVRGTVLNYKSKRSQDCNNIDMSLVKETIEEIIKPLTHICNVSFRTGIFPDQMKVAKVIPLFKAGNKNDQIIDLYHFFHSFLKYWKNFLLKGWIVLLINIIF